MDLKEWTPILVIAGSALGIISTGLGFAVWILKSHIQSKDAQIAELRLGNKKLEAEAEEFRRRAERRLIQSRCLRKGKCSVTGNRGRRDKGTVREAHQGNRGIHR